MINFADASSYVNPVAVPPHLSHLAVIIFIVNYDLQVKGINLLVKCGTKHSKKRQSYV